MGGLRRGGLHHRRRAPGAEHDRAVRRGAPALPGDPRHQPGDRSQGPPGSALLPRRLLRRGRLRPRRLRAVHLQPVGVAFGRLGRTRLLAAPVHRPREPAAAHGPRRRPGAPAGAARPPAAPSGRPRPALRGPSPFGRLGPARGPALPALALVVAAQTGRRHLHLLFAPGLRSGRGAQRARPRRSAAAAALALAAARPAAGRDRLRGRDDRRPRPARPRPHPDAGALVQPARRAAPAGGTPGAALGPGTPARTGSEDHVMTDRPVKDRFAAALFALLCSALPAAPAFAKTFRLPAPVTVKAKVDRAIESDKEANNTEFLVVVSGPLKAEGCFVLKPGAAGQGRVVASFPPEKKGVPGKLQLQLTKLTFADGKSRPISTKSLERVGEKPKSEKVMKILWSKKGGPATVAANQELTFETDADIELEMDCVKQ